VRSSEREDYIRNVREQGFSLITQRQRSRYIDDFLHFLETHFRRTSPTSIRREDVLQYARGLTVTKQALGTLRVKAAVVLQWLRWLADTGRIRGNPAGGLVPAKLLPTLKNDKRTVSPMASSRASGRGHLSKKGRKHLAPDSE